MVRVDDQRFVQLLGGTGELAEDQHPLLVIAGSHELFCHQIHPVMQAGHHADVGCPEITVHLLWFVVDRLEKNRLPGSAGEALVDVQCQVAYL